MRLDWGTRVWRRTVCAGLVAVALWCAGATGARAFAVVSNGIVYEVEITGLATGVSFNAANAGGALKQTPWFGDFAFARDVAAALPADILSGGMEVFLPYRLSLAGLTVNSIVGTAHGLGLDLFRNRNDSIFDLIDGTLAPHQAWALGTAREMPEIDGPALAQVLFILGAALMALRGRRSGTALVARPGAAAPSAVRPGGGAMSGRPGSRGAVSRDPVCRDAVCRYAGPDGVVRGGGAEDEQAAARASGAMAVAPHVPVA